MDLERREQARSLEARTHTDLPVVEDEDDKGDDGSNDDRNQSETSDIEIDVEMTENVNFQHLTSPSWRQLAHRVWHPLTWFKKESYERLDRLDSDNNNDHQDAGKVKTLPTSTMGIFWHSLSRILLASKLNLSIIFVPIGLATYMIEAPPISVFVTNGIAIVPLSALLTDATERLAHEVGDTIGALLNITLGNLVELIIFVALRDGHTRIVEASILGSILVNILLILGSALLVCSVFDAKDFRPTASSQILGCLLFVSVFAFLIPTAFQSAFDEEDETHRATLKMSRITACIVLLIYMLYMFHEIRTPHQPKKTEQSDVDLESRLPASEAVTESYYLQPISATQNEAGLPPRTIRFADAEPSHEHATAIASAVGSHTNGDPTLVFDADTEQNSHHAKRLTQAPVSAYRSHHSRTRSARSSSLGSTHRPRSADEFETPHQRYTMAFPTMRSIARPSLDETGIRRIIELSKPREHPGIERAVSILILFITSMLMSMNAEFLVSTIDQITHKGNFSEAIIGLIILPIVGNMAEYITVVTVAVRENLDLAVAVSVGSSIQIALCVAPLTVLAGWLLDRDLLLTFNFFEMATLMGTILLVNIIALTGTAGPSTSNALRGGLICGCYAIIAVGAYLDPETGS